MIGCVILVEATDFVENQVLMTPIKEDEKSMKTLRIKQTRGKPLEIKRERE